MEAQFNKNYYFDGTTTYSFDEAVSFCKQKRASLLVPESYAEQTFINDQYAKQVWMGIKKQPGGSYTEINTSSLKFSNWYSGHPKCITSCCSAYLDTDNTWMSVSCESKRYVVCEIRTFKDCQTMSCLKFATNHLFAERDRLNVVLDNIAETLRANNSRLRQEINDSDSRVIQKINSSDEQISLLWKEIAQLSNNVTEYGDEYSNILQQLELTQDQQAEDSTNISATLLYYHSVHIEELRVRDKAITALKRNISELSQNLRREHVINSELANELILLQSITMDNAQQQNHTLEDLNTKVLLLSLDFQSYSSVLHTIAVAAVTSGLFCFVTTCVFLNYGNKRLQKALHPLPIYDIDRDL